MRSPRELLFLFLSLLIAPAILTSCGSSTSTSSNPASVTVSCAAVQVTVGGTVQCNATVLNESSTLVNWSISPSGTGSISSSGLYTAPAAFPSNNQNVVTVTAASVVQTSVTGTATITVEQATQISNLTCLDPSTNASSTTVSSGNSLDCSATSSTGANVAVNWSVNAIQNGNPTIGQITSGGVYTAPLAPPTPQTVTITATSQAASSNSMSVMVTVGFGNKVLSGLYAFSMKGRVTNSTNAFFARVGSFSAGGGTISGGIEDTNQSGPSGTVMTQRTFTGSYSVGSDGRGVMQFCEDTSASCPLFNKAATASFSIVVTSKQQAQIIDFSVPTNTTPPPTSGSAEETSEGEMVLIPDTTIFNVGGLSGTYSFGFSGISSAGTEESVVGEFNASGVGNNGLGSISAGNATTPGELDIDGGGAQFLAASSYRVLTNGRGTMTLNGLSFSFYLVSASQAKFMEIDSSPASILAGDAFKQQAGLGCTWGSNALSNAVVFETSGETGNTEIQDVGSFNATSTSSTAGTISGASIDQNAGGTYTPATGTGAGSYTVDSCGRGTLSIGSHSYVFYPISATNAVLQETTSGVVARGFLTQSQGGPFTSASLKGSYALQLDGTNAPGASASREDIVGQLTSNGSGAISGGTLDVNNFGATSGQAGVAITSGIYAVAAAGSSAAGALRATVTLTPTRSLVLYLVSPTLFYVLDTDATGTGIGTLYDQF